MIWFQHEPTLAMLLADPLVQAVMAADGVERDELEATLQQVSRRLALTPGAAENFEARS